MRILQLCKKYPYPLKDGESIAVTNIAAALTNLGAEVTLLAMNTNKHAFDTSKINQTLPYYKAKYTVNVDTDVKILPALKNLFSSDSYHISRFISTDFEKKLIHLLKESTFDIIQLETLFLAPYIDTIRKYSSALIVMRAHNVEHEIWERITTNTSSLIKKKYLRHLTSKLKNFEKSMLHKYDLLLPITHKDYNTFKKLGFNGNAQIVPIGMNISKYTPDYSSFKKDLSLSFIGSLDWMPNIEGLKWFLDNIWSKVHQQFPDIHLHIAGRNTPDWVKNINQDNIIVHGEVDDATQFINQHSIMVVPLLSGSGMRAKILEGMALGKVIISTSIGIEGIPAKNKGEVMVADDPKEFIEAIDWCLNQNGTLEKMGTKAKQFIHENYDNIEITQDLLATYHKAIPKINKNTKIGAH